MKDRDLKDIEDNPDSSIVILKDALSFTLVGIVRQVPLISSGMGGFSDFNYLYLKDLCKWNNLKPLNISVPLITRLIQIRMNAINTKK